MSDSDGSLFADVGACSIRYRISGSPHSERATLVLLHELGGSLDSWDGFAAVLGEERRVLRYDMRGSGASEKIRGDLSINDLANDLVKLLDVVGLSQPVVLAGSAMGAAVALSFAVRNPERVMAVIAMAPALDLSPDAAANALAIAARIEREGMRARVDAAMDSAYPAVLRNDRQRYESHRSRWLANDPSSYAASLRALARMRLCAQLGAVRCPVLVIAGEVDPNRSLQQLRDLLSGLANPTFISILSGHFMAVQTPELVALEVRAFLEEQEQGQEQKGLALR